MAGLYRFFCNAVDISRSLFVISVNDGLAAGSGDQHTSINFFHSESQRFGIGGLSVLFTIPPSYKFHTTQSDHQNHNRATLNEGCMIDGKDRSIISKLCSFKNIGAVQEI